jgi:tRNA (cmo5U34)-methyltransferase
MSSLAEVWKVPTVVDDYLARRAAIPLVKEQIDVMLELLATRETPVRQFLDLGCGDGILGATVLERFPGSHGVLLDFSEPMLDQARNFLRGAGARLDLLLADYAQPDWTEKLRDQAPFDAVVSGYSIHHQPDERKRQLYAEIFDLLSPGGWFINIEHVAPAAGITSRLFGDHFINQAFDQETKSGGAKTRPQIAEEIQRRPDIAANILAPVEAQCGWLRQLGYGEVDCYFKYYELAVFGGQRPPNG